MASDMQTVPTKASVQDFLNRVEDEVKRRDSFSILALMGEITGEEPVMWGPAIVGFGSVHYRYATGREGDMPVVGFSPRRQSLTLYVMSGFEEQHALLQKLGKHSTGQVCLYIKRLSDIDRDVLREIITKSVAHVKALHSRTR